MVYTRVKFHDTTHRVLLLDAVSIVSVRCVIHVFNNICVDPIIVYGLACRALRIALTRRKRMNANCVCRGSNLHTERTNARARNVYSVYS